MIKLGRRSSQVKICFRKSFAFFTFLICMPYGVSLALFCGYSLQTQKLRSLRQLTTRTRRMVMATSTQQHASIDQNEPSKPLVVIIAGPTGVGKSDVAAKLCASEKGMIVSADSVQAYRGVQIGANKPSPAERLETPHILVDVADHTENYNAADWRKDALFSIQSLLRQNNEPKEASIEEDNATLRQQSIGEYIRQARIDKGFDENERILPVVCGGTMMYIQWLVHGRPDAMRPSESAAQKAIECIAQYQANEDWEAAIEHASSFGPVFADRVSKFCGLDWYRLRRTLEVAYTVMEKPTDDKDSIIEELYTGLREGSLSSLGYDVRCFFLCPDDRMNHTEVVDRRCEQMVMRGLLEETTDLHLSDSLPEMATRAIGYRQTLDYLTRDSSSDDTVEQEAFEHFLHEFAGATRRYAKTQMSWFRKDKQFLFVPVPLSLPKSDRVQVSAETIKKLCQMTREDYENEITDKSGISIKTKDANEKQGKKMKFYQYERHTLKTGTEEFNSALVQAIACCRQVQAKKP